MNDLIDQAKGHGFDVYGPAELTTYFYFTDGQRVGYCQTDRMRGPSWATVHKPNPTTGTGFKAAGFAEALQQHAPSWAFGPVKKYADWADFAKKHWQPLIQY
jgi:hypothetical protein